MTDKQLVFSMTEYLPNITAIDTKRWTKHVRGLYEILKDTEWHSKQELLEATNTGNFQARIHDLRQSGFVVECLRKGKTGSTIYRIKEYVGISTTKTKHCYCCRYNDDFVESNYTG